MQRSKNVVDVLSGVFCGLMIIAIIKADILGKRVFEKFTHK